MGIRYLKTQAVLEGHVPADDAETLAQWLHAHPRGQVHLGQCESLHTALLQTLLALKPRIKAPPPSAWLCVALGLTDSPSRTRSST